MTTRAGKIANTKLAEAVADKVMLIVRLSMTSVIAASVREFEASEPTERNQAVRIESLVDGTKALVTRLQSEEFRHELGQTIEIVLNHEAKKAE